MTTTLVQLNHPKLKRALEARMRLMLLDPAFTLTPKQVNKFKRIKLRIVDGDNCYTDFNRITLGLGYPGLSGTDIDKQFHLANVINAHEVGHLHFTSKKDWNKFIYGSMQKYKSLGPLAKDVLNILEDRRIERLMGLVYTSMQKYFFLVGYKETSNIPDSINEKLKSGVPDVSMKLQMIRNLLLYMSYTRIVPNIQNEEIKEYLKACYPYVLYARTAKSTADAVKATNKVLNVLKPLIEEYLESVDEPFGGKYKIIETGTTTPTPISGLSGFGGASGTSSLPSDVETLVKGLVEAVEKEIEKDEEDEEDDDEDGFVVAEDEEEELEEEELVTDVPGMLQDIANALESYELYDEKFGEEIEEMEKGLHTPITKEILEEMLNSKTKEQKQSFQAAREVKNIEDLEIEINEEMHKACKAYFKSQKEMVSFTQEEYDNLIGPLGSVVRRTVAQIRELSQTGKGEVNRRLRSGKLDSRMLTNVMAFDDVHAFKETDTKEFDFELMLLVDVSGSNNQQMLNQKNDVYVHRYVMNQIVSMLLHEILKKLKFKHTIWTFYEGSSTKQIFSPVITRANCFEKDAGLFLKEVGAYSNNRDGYSIRYAGKYFNKMSRNSNRIMIVLSDGQPSASNYGGMSAVNDVRAAVDQVEKGGSKVIGIFTGHEQENDIFAMMYPNHIYCNNESIFKLPMILKDVLVTEFKDVMR